MDASSAGFKVRLLALLVCPSLPSDPRVRFSLPLSSNPRLPASPLAIHSAAPAHCHSVSLVFVEDTTYKLRLWDTAGQALQQCRVRSPEFDKLLLITHPPRERFDALTGFYARGARAVVICYDMTDRDT
ncbi:MAG: hypothetical protein SGPRY_002830 [Prymnesium sp.]